ncbi:MAG TPA: ADP-dependent glucokinase/phosphofructokinase [Acidimicrobiales bacterium]|nr:ADP-dependent glucokinase/phosphofructokinase [Acidimicrobiales bacterium]
MVWCADGLSDRAGPLTGAAWPEKYRELAERLMAVAPHQSPALVSSTVDIDEVYEMSPARVRALAEGDGKQGGLGALFLEAVEGCLRREVDSELSWDWPDGRPWLQEVLGVPDRVQVGGTGPQAAWALGALGAPSVMALGRRGREQLSVLPDGVLLCAGGELVPAHTAVPTESELASRHEILEFPRGSLWAGGRLQRPSRIIVRFAPIALEVDAEFLGMQEGLSGKAGAALMAGLNGLGADDWESRDWAVHLARVWKDNGIALRHLELGDTSRPAEFRDIVSGLRGLFSSVGLNSSELQRLWRSSSDVPAGALELANILDCSCLVVHSDRWSLAAHRGDRVEIVQRLMAGNLLAAARAGRGVPQRDVRPTDGSEYSSDLPPSGAAANGWWVECVPTPHRETPASTIGLGDTFTAGVILATALSPGAN